MYATYQYMAYFNAQLRSSQFMENSKRDVATAHLPLHLRKWPGGTACDDGRSNRDAYEGFDSMNVAGCPRCGADGIKIGRTLLPEGDEAYEQYCCLKCGHGFMLKEREKV